MPLPHPPGRGEEEPCSYPEIALKVPGDGAVEIGRDETREGTQGPLLARVPDWGFQPLSSGVALLQQEITLPFSFLKGKRKKATNLMSILTHHFPEP